MARLIVGFHGDEIPEELKSIQGARSASEIIESKRYTCLILPPTVDVDVGEEVYTIGEINVSKGLIAAIDVR